jgi:TPR repeat protein
VSVCKYRLALLSALIPCAVLATVPEGVEAFAKGKFVEARKELAKPAEEGDAQAMAYMAEMLMRGQGGGRDELTARTYITKAHEAGNPHATFTLGLIYLSGSIFPRDDAKGAELIRMAADKGEAAAQNAIGAWLANGSQGYAKDDVEAVSWFKRAAEQKYPAAMAWMGAFTEAGRGGLVRDDLVALDWFKKSGELGNATAMTSAGRMYAQGLGVGVDGAEALRWFQRGAAANNLDAFLWIAAIYEAGRGSVVRNPVLAYAWYSAIPANASATALKKAADGKERLEKVLSATELQEAQKQAKTVVAANAVKVIALALVENADSKPRSGIFGSGVVVSPAGDIVTNEHVIHNCARIRIQPLGSSVTVTAKDVRNDLALLRVEGGGLPPLRLRSGRNLRLGDEVMAIGYPLKGVLSSGAVVTNGIVNALSGVNDDSSTFQISATVQPGSSGGPILDRNGNLVGIVRARLLPTAPNNPQNVNFGINLGTLSSFLDSHSVDYATAAGAAKHSEMADLVERARKSTVQVECY